MKKESQTKSNKAVIYCRVSTKEQVDEGGSLGTQEKICKEYANKNGYDVIKVFVEEGESAKTANRTELKKLFNYCAEKKNLVSTLIIYKLDRVSRNTDDYSQIRILLKKYGVEIKSTSEFFEDNPVGRFMENTMANIAQFDNDIRSERCAGGMKDAMREGRYVWMAPVGYSNVRDENSKSTIAPNHMAPLIKEAYETIAKGLHAIDEVRVIMNKKGLVSRVNKPIIKSYFPNMLKNRAYIGMIEKFGESHKGLFEPIVSENLFNQVQRVLKNKGRKMSQYKKDNEDFPLRRFVKDSKGSNLTGSWSQGRSKKYAFYRFGGINSNHQKDEFEKNFMSYMDTFALKDIHIDKLKKLVEQKLVKKTAGERKEAEKAKMRIDELVKRQSLIVDKNIKGILNDNLAKQQLDLIEKEIVDARIYVDTVEESTVDPLGLIELTEAYIKQPSLIWKEAKLEKRKKLQWFEFPLGLNFIDGIFRTTETAKIFKTKETFLSLQSTQVDPTGLEPATPSLQMRCSTR